MTNPAYEATNSDVEKLKPGKYAILYRDNWDGEGDTYHTLANLEPDGRWLSDETGKELLEYEGDEILKAWPLDDGADTMALIAALEQAKQESKELQVQLAAMEGAALAMRDDMRAAREQLEAAPSGMIPLSNELAEMKRKCAELKASHHDLRESMAAIHNTIRGDGAHVSLSVLLSATKNAWDKSAGAADLKVEGGDHDA